MNDRYVSASNYLLSLEESLNKGWEQYYRENPEASHSKLALLHPDHIKELDLPAHLTPEKIQVSIQGRRAFSSGVSGKCQSSLLWGYECELNGDIEQDHLFPYSLGGPTLGNNRVLLCRYHNMVKASDIHCFPWESSNHWISPWVDTQVDKLFREVFNIHA